MRIKLHEPFYFVNIFKRLFSTLTFILKTHFWNITFDD